MFRSDTPVALTLTRFELCFVKVRTYFPLGVFFFQAEDGIRDIGVTGVQTCALPIFGPPRDRAQQIDAQRPDLALQTGRVVGADGVVVGQRPDRGASCLTADREGGDRRQIGRASCRERV